MRNRSAYLGVFFCLLGAAVIPLAGDYFIRLQGYYKLQEAYFLAPVYSATPILTLRQDGYGKGYFGAPRDGKRTHKGIDVLAHLKEPVLASKSGRVVFAGLGKGYGLYIQIAHPDGLTTLYAHLTRCYVKSGDWVSIGSVVGNCGKSGNAANPRIKPHVHFEIQSPSGVLNPGAGLLSPTITIRRS